MPRTLKVAALLLALHLAPIYGQTIRYVDKSATGSKNGTSWQNAYTDLYAAIVSAKAGTQIWVKMGTYLAPKYNGWEMKNNVAIYGGFFGGETDLSQRNWTDNQTILMGNGSRVIQNGYQSPQTNNSAILDGFTITGGDVTDESNDKGGAIYNEYASPTLRNLKITGNRARLGGGIANISSSAVISDVFITLNEATDGGGIYNNYGSPTLRNSQLWENDAYHQGGAIFNEDATPVCSNLIVFKNTAGNGGGIKTLDGKLTCYNSVFYKNEAQTGGALAFEECEGVLTNLTISNNSGYYSGGGIFNLGAYITVANSVLCYNSSMLNGQPNISNSSGNSSFQYSMIQGIDGGNWANIGYDNGDNIDASVPTFENSLNDDLRLKEGCLAINAGNSALLPSTITTDLLGNPRITGSTIDMGAYEYTSIVGVAEIKAHTTWNMFPNPAKALVQFSPGEAYTQPFMLKIHDLSGRLIQEKMHTPETPLVLDVSGYPDGVYTASIFCEGRPVETKRLMVVK